MQKINASIGEIVRPITGIVKETRHVTNAIIGTPSGTGKVRLSKKPNNRIREESDGLYVPPLTWNESEW